MIVEDLVIGVKVALWGSARKGGVTISRVLLVQQRLDEWFQVALVGLEEKMATGFQKLVDLLRP